MARFSLFIRMAISGLVLAALSACVPPCEAPKPDPGKTWRAFKAGADANFQGRDFLLQASINLFGKNRSDRLVITAWGRMDGIVRADIEAGIGKTLAMWIQKPDRWTAFYPMQNKAYYHQDSRTGMNLLGFPSPCTLKELVALCTARLQNFVPDHFQEISDCGPACLRFTFDSDSPAASVDLGPGGQLLAVSGHRGWSVRYAPFDAATGPERLDLFIDNETKAVIRIKQYSIRSEPWPASSLDLPLPEETPVLRLLDTGGGVAP